MPLLSTTAHCHMAWASRPSGLTPLPRLPPPHVSARFADCAVANDYIAEGGTWEVSCEDAFGDATEDCLGADLDYEDRDSPIPAYAVAGYITKTGTIDAYLGVPDSYKSGKVSAAGEQHALVRAGQPNALDHLSFSFGFPLL